MTNIDTRATLNATSATAVLDRLRAGPRAAAPARPLSPEALAVAAKPLQQPVSPIVLAGAVRMAEFALIVAVGMAIFALYLPSGEGLYWRYQAATICIAALSMLAFQTADIYQVQAFRGYEKQYLRLASAWSVVFLIVIGVSFFAKAGDMFSRVWLGSYYVVGLAALILSRNALFFLVRQWTREGRLTRRTVIVGGGEPGAHVIEELRRQKDSDVEIIGLFDDRGDDRTGTECAGERKLGTVDDLVEFGRRTRVDLVIFSLPISAEGRILQMLKKLWVLPVDIRLSAHTNKLQFRPRSYSYIGNVPVLDVFDRPIADWDVVMKWLFDKIIGGLVLILVSPILLAVAIAIKLDSRGPVFFKQKRYGFNNDLIEVYKFRSMYTDMTDAMRQQAVTKDDPRVTRSAVSSARPASTSCRSSSTWCSRATCRWSARGRTRSTPRPKTATTTRRSTAISRAIASSPASPAGRRSTAGAARPTRMRRSSAASSTISTTSRTGRCCSTSTSWRGPRSRCSTPRMRIDHRRRHGHCRGAAGAGPGPISDLCAGDAVSGTPAARWSCT